MYTLYLQKCGQYRLIGHYDDEKKMNDYIRAYRVSKGLENKYTRLMTEKVMNELMTCVDFGSWSEFFYIYPALDWMNPK